MKIVRIRFSNCVLAFDDHRMPVAYHFHNAAAGVTMEVRHEATDSHTFSDSQTFVYGWVERNGVTRYAGQHNGQWSHSPADRVFYISSEMLRLAGELDVEAHHVRPFVEQLPLFTDDGVDVEEAIALEGPIKDLLARGATPTEVMNSLDVEKATIEFVLGIKLPPSREVFSAEASEDPPPEISGW